MMRALDRLIAEITVLWGWRRFAVALIAGALSALALAPVHAIPVLFVTLPTLIWLIDGVAAPGRAGAWPRLVPARTAFAIGWAFGLGYFIAGLYWVGFALLIDADRYAWALPLAVVVLPAGLALFTGLSTMLARLVWRPGYGRVVVLAGTWTACEWLRGAVLTGFPWNRLGQAFAGSDQFLQAAAYGGDLGLTALAVLTAGAPATIADIGRADHSLRRLAPTFLALAALAAVWAGGAARLDRANAGTVPAVAIRIVQPNVPQALKWDPDHRSATIARYLEMSDLATSPDSMGIASVTHLIWPETALPLLMESSPEVLAQIAALLPQRTTLIAGGLRAEPPRGGPDARYFNSVFVIGGDGTIQAVYDKRHLVPFGEFLPFQRQLEQLGLTQLTGQLGGFERGETSRLMAAGAAPRFAALICYEIIFSTRLFDPATRPGWLVNVTNDAWFGDSSGPWQHLAQARLRAAEEGLPVVRAANTGISAVIDSYGRVVDLLPTGRRGVIDAALPAPIEPTFYASHGRLPLAVVLALAMFATFMFRSRHPGAPAGTSGRGRRSSSFNPDLPRSGRGRY